MTTPLSVGITGASGLIGTALSAHLRSIGHTVVPIVRRTPAAGEIEWQPTEDRLDAASLAPLDAVVHLSGAGIGDRRWTESYKQTLLESRTVTTSLLSRRMAEADGPKTLISGSGVSYYGDRPDAEVDETTEGGEGFLVDIVRAWEGATEPAEEAGIRVAHIRTGIVLTPRGGALKRMLPLFKLGLGGKFGDGEQWMSWISMTDQVGAITHLLTSQASGPFNLTAPTPVRNADFADTLGDVLNRPSFLPVPKFGPRLLLGRELADSLLFEGQRALPRALLDDGYEFTHPTLDVALRAELGR